MLCNVSEPKKVSNHYGFAKVGLDYLILLDIDNILVNIVKYFLRGDLIIKQAGLSWGSVQAETVRLQS